MPARPRRPEYVVLGGTFDHLHAGHRALLETAFEWGRRVGIGLTTDELLHRWGSKQGAVAGYEQRLQNLTGYLGRRYERRRWRILPLSDRWGALLRPETRGVVVSEETLPVALRANRIRSRRGISPVEVRVVPRLVGEDLLPISSTRVRRGEIDEEGRRKIPLRVGLGTGNPEKIRGLRGALRDLFRGLPLRWETREWRDGPEQPRGLGAGFAGARARAYALPSNCDYRIGVEATVLRLPRGHWIDVHCLCALDSTGESLESLSLGFPLPRAVAPAIRSGEDLSHALRLLGAPETIGRRPGGALGYLSGGRLGRAGIIRDAVIAAFAFRLALREGRWRPYPWPPRDSPGAGTGG
jgi:cytidyltransferase-like protein